MANQDEIRLNELDKEEFRDIAKALDKDYSDQKFDQAWAEFARLKNLKSLH